MMILPTSDLLPALEQHLAEATGVDLAVAWAWSCQALLLLEAAAKRGVAVRAVVGLSGCGTQPHALRSLATFGRLRVVPDRAGSRGLFHPKVFVFRKKSGDVSWIGSANLTTGGFVNNVEVMAEAAGAAATGATAWFSSLWKGLDADPEGAIAAYTKGWKPPRNSGAITTHSRSAVPAKIALPVLLDHKPRDWAGYFTALEQADQHWRHRTARSDVAVSVLGETFSWMETIQTGSLLARRTDWTNFSRSERAMLLGLNDKEGAWGLLGSMKGAGYAKQVFGGASKEAREGLRRLRAALEPVFQARTPDATADAAAAAIEEMQAVKGVNIGVATRLLALARPDVCVTVNGGSIPKLVALLRPSHTAYTLRRPEGVRDLMAWVLHQPWYRSPRPTSPMQAAAWDARAALIDCFNYEPV